MEKHLTDVIEFSADAIAVFSVDERIKMFNKAALEIYGYSESEIFDKSIEVLFEIKEDVKVVERKLCESPNNQIHNYEVRTKDKKGRIIPVNLSVSWLLDEKREKVGSVGVFRDLRRIKELQEIIIQSERMAAMGVMANRVAHELKHDLNAIILYAQALNRLVSEDTKVSEITQKIINVSEKGTDKLIKMLKAVRPEPPKKEIWDVKELFDDITVVLREKSKIKGISFNIYYADYLAKIEVDSKQIKEVLDNLFSNSLEAIEEEGEGEIKLSLQQEADKLLICWENTGKVIPEEDISKIFDPFFTTKMRGTGLGLSLVQVIIINNGGKIWVDPNFQNGARFHIELPNV